MSQENLATVRRMIQANRSGGQDAVIDLFAEGLVDDDCELVSRISSIEGSSYRGREGVLRYLEDLEDAFQEWHNDLGETTVIAPDAILAVITFRATSRSGISVELQSFSVWNFSGATLVRFVAYPTREQALRAAGLSE